MEMICECVESFCFAKHPKQMKNLKYTCKLTIKGLNAAKKLFHKIEKIKLKIYLGEGNLEKLNTKLEKCQASKRKYDVFLWKMNYYFDECTWGSEKLETLDIALDYWMWRMYHEHCISDLTGLSPGDIDIRPRSIRRFFASSRVYR